jgi:hypothetical protein
MPNAFEAMVPTSLAPLVRSLTNRPLADAIERVTTRPARIKALPVGVAVEVIKTINDPVLLCALTDVGDKRSSVYHALRTHRATSRMRKHRRDPGPLAVWPGGAPLAVPALDDADDAQIAGWLFTQPAALRAPALEQVLHRNQSYRHTSAGNGTAGAVAWWVASGNVRGVEYTTELGDRIATAFRSPASAVTLIGNGARELDVVDTAAMALIDHWSATVPVDTGAEITTAARNWAVRHGSEQTITQLIEQRMLDDRQLVAALRRFEPRFQTLMLIKHPNRAAAEALMPGLDVDGKRSSILGGLLGNVAGLTMRTQVIVAKHATGFELYKWFRGGTDGNTPTAAAAREVLDAVADGSAYCTVDELRTYIGYAGSDAATPTLQQAASFVVTHARGHLGALMEDESKLVARTAASLLLDRLGENTEWWTMALGLIDDWDGTLPELCEAAAVLS